MTMALGATVQFSDGGGSGVFNGSPQQIIDGIGQYQAAGVQDFRFDFPAPSIEGVLSLMERFASEVRPHVA
jgi:alkanesulfonate monooxygenase SsuD/methylene tetrahydromethanopterin reductase-like flavin-dependent oxidoreductase (luciferase family)